MTVSDVRHDYARALHTTSEGPATDEVAAALSELAARATSELADAGFEADRVRLHNWVDARYVDQVHELLVPVPAGTLDDAAFAQVAASFHALHEERYGWSAPERAVEYLHWRTAGTGLIDARTETGFGDLDPVDAEAARTGSRDAYFEELGGFVETPSYAAERFAAGGRITGPALIDSPTTTIVVFPGQALTADGHGSFLIETA
jgi:N-methylhydantoinase A